MKLTIGFSPCPNDTFIFDALINRKINTGDFTFEAVLEDVETLNAMAQDGKLDITKLSFPAFFRASNLYTLLDAGSALGKGVGPLLVSKEDKPEYDIDNSSIAIPGVLTTANLLLSFARPHAKNKIPMIFSAIEDAVANGETDLGLIIHENRFTYRDKGLFKVMDMGEYWESHMKLPIPLGGIAGAKRLGHDTSKTVSKLVRQSLEYAFANYPMITDYVKVHSQAMQENVMRQHIDLYVNNYSLDLGADGRNAIAVLADVYSNISGTDVVKKEGLFL